MRRNRFGLSTAPAAFVIAWFALSTVAHAEYNVVDFGALCDNPGIDSTEAFQDALDAAAAAGGGIVRVPHCRFYFAGNLVTNTNPFLHPYGVVLAGAGVGPYDPLYDPRDTTRPPQGPTLLPRFASKDSPFITINGSNSAIQDLLFDYPDQLTNPSQPDVYAATIRVDMPAKISRCFFSNSYIAIDVRIGRVFLEKLHIGAFKNDIIVDNAFDVVHISQVSMSIFRNYDLPFPQPIDRWVLENGSGITSHKADGLFIDNVLVFYRNTGIAFLNSPLVAQDGVTSGVGSNVNIDTVRYGVVAEATHLVVGFLFNNLLVGASPLPPVGVGGENMIWLQEGAQPPHTPKIVVNGGSTRGLWEKALRVDAGTLSVSDVIGLNPIGRLPALGIPAPVLPASDVPYVSNLPADGRVMINGGSVSEVRIGGQSTGLTSGMFLVSPGESIAVVYSSPPAWSWFLN